MSDQILHECGLAMIRLRQPLSYYRDRYGDPAWGLRRLYLLMEKQHNRGQDGAGVAALKFDMPPGERFLNRVRTSRRNALERIFDVVMPKMTNGAGRSLQTGTDIEAKQRFDFLGEVMLGHLRYATFSGHARTNCHPYVRRHNVASKNLAVAGNFNMTNAPALFQRLVEFGLNPVGDSDTQVILEKIGYFLDREHDHLTSTMGPESFLGLEGRELARSVSDGLDIARVLRKASQDWDGGYVFCGMVGNGDTFVIRDPAGIRPGFYYIDDEVIAAASERAALTNVFDVAPTEVHAIEPGHAVIVKRNGSIKIESFTEKLPLKQCTFERIYFSRGNDPDIYGERKRLGQSLAPRVMTALNDEPAKAVFSYIPNTAEAAYVGLVAEMDELNRRRHAADLWRLIEKGEAQRSDLDHLLNGRLRAEKIAHKDQRLRTFITHDSARRDLVAHIYDVTRGVVKPDDALVVLDDSIVRGTTLRESIITILSRLNPREIIVVSSAPPIKYPDCYGIDMSQLGRFIAFEAAVALLHERDEAWMLDDVEEKCLAQRDLPVDRMTNQLGAIYNRFSLDELSEKIAELVTPVDLAWKGRVRVIYQTVDSLLAAMPEHQGVWYFTGEYPTPGGYDVLNTSYLNWRQHVDARAY